DVTEDHVDDGEQHQGKKENARREGKIAQETVEEVHQQSLSRFPRLTCGADRRRSADQFVGLHELGARQAEGVHTLGFLLCERPRIPQYLTGWVPGTPRSSRPLASFSASGRKKSRHSLYSLSDSR